jgi:hypothetical protein
MVSIDQQKEKRVLLADTLPALATELRRLLEEQGESELAAQVPGLMILDRCRRGGRLLRYLLHEAQAEGRLWSRSSERGPDTR